MAVTEQIMSRTAQLPPALQREVLDFVEFLAQRMVAQQQIVAENAEWSALSSAHALDGLPAETEYTEADLLEKWQ